MREKILPILLFSSITVIPGQALAAGTLTSDIGVKLVIGEGGTVSRLVYHHRTRLPPKWRQQFRSLSEKHEYRR